MNCLAWNCRGLGNPRTVQEIARLVHAQDLSVVFLIETWQDNGPLERLRCQLQFENKFVASSKILEGGSEAESAKFLVLTHRCHC